MDAAVVEKDFAESLGQSFSGKNPADDLERELLGEEDGPRYDFDESFQSKIAALVIRDTIFNQHTEGLIKPDYFEDRCEAALVNMVLKYYGKYHKSPERKIFVQLLRDEISAKTIRQDMIPAIKQKVLALNGSDLSDRDYVIDKVAEFARHQAVERAILESVDHLQRRDFSKIDKAVKQALDVGINLDAGSYDYFGELEGRTMERKLRAAGELPPTGITTGIPVIDDKLYHKGWGRKELTVLMAGAKAGKTTAMINFGINAAAAGYNVAYFTLEVAARIIAERMDANISDQIISEMGSHIFDVQEKVADFKRKAGQFKIYEFPTGMLTPSDIRRVIERNKSQGVMFDLVIVDYADLMQPDHRVDQTIENSKNVYVGLRGIAMMEDLAMLTATQTNREGYKAAVAKAEHVSEDFNKIRIADLVISINKTEEERALNQARLYFAASRNQAGGYTITIEQSLDRMKFITRVLDEGV